MGGNTREVIAYFGGPKSYGEMALREEFGESVEPLLLDTALECLGAVADGRAAGTLVPCRNIITGDIRMDGIPVMEMASGMSLHKVSERRVRVRLVLASAGTLDEVKVVFSIQPAIDQCGDFFKSHEGLTPAGTFQDEKIKSTSAAAERVKNMNVEYAAAICDADAAKLHGLPVILDRVADKEPNYTFFFLYRREPTG